VSVHAKEFEAQPIAQVKPHNEEPPKKFMSKTTTAYDTIAGVASFFHF
jgi:hypothetical protein